MSESAAPTTAAEQQQQQPSLPFPQSAAGLPPGYTISRCHPRDTSEMVRVYLRSFRPTDFSYWWPPPLSSSSETGEEEEGEGMIRWTTTRFGTRYGDVGEQQFKITYREEGKGEGEGEGKEVVVAYARWDVPPSMRGEGSMGKGFVPFGVEEEEDDAALSGPEKKSRQGPPEGADVELHAEFFGGIKMMAGKWGAKDRLGLSVLCTDPAHSGKGLGAALMRPVLAMADDSGMTTYLEAIRRATPLYERQGFGKVDLLEYDPSRKMEGKGKGKVYLDIMIREPRTTTTTTSGGE